MKRKIFFISLFCISITYAQDRVAEIPEQAIISSSDVTNFWRAYDKMESGSAANPFQEYIVNGSFGVQNFLAHNRIVNADTLLATVRKRKSDYLATRSHLAEMEKIRTKCLSHYYALEYLYPKAIYPPLYFVMGRFNTGGVATPQMQIIGTEMNSPENISYIVAHELIHAQQNIPYKYRILLEQCIVEGSADFLGEIISGRVASSGPYDYARGREVLLWEEFKKDMELGENDDFGNWLYGMPRTDGRPNDMGYYIGYVITKAYYDRATDKRRAIEEILNIKDCKQFLKDSGYQPVATASEGNKPATPVTFACTSCKKANRLEVSGPESKVLKDITFPLDLKLAPGKYSFKYWQKNILQIQSSFEVSGSGTTINVK